MFIVRIRPSSSFSIFFCSINWFIKDPGTEKSHDFYFKPFEMDIWFSILLTIFLGGITSLTLHYLSSRKLRNNNEIFQPFNDVFMPIDCLCSQG